MFKLYNILGTQFSRQTASRPNHGRFCPHSLKLMKEMCIYLFMLAGLISNSEIVGIRRGASNNATAPVPPMYNRYLIRFYLKILSLSSGDFIDVSLKVLKCLPIRSCRFGWENVPILTTFLRF